MSASSQRIGQVLDRADWLKLVSRSNPNEPKKRPSPPTPITLPVYEVTLPDPRQVVSVEPSKLNALVVQTSINRWTTEHHRALGVELTNGAYIEDLVPTSYIPPKSWEQRPTPEQSTLGAYDTLSLSTDTLSNGAAVPGHEAFHGRVNELKQTREEALNALDRKNPPQGKKKIKISHFRKFWLSIDNVSRYWDTSMDDWRPPGAAKPQKSPGLHHDVQAEAPRDHGLKQQQERNLAIGAGPSTGNLRPSADGNEQEEMRDYYGLRTGDGRSMEPSHRAELVANLLEPITHVMGCFYEQRNQASGFSPSRAVRFQNGLIRLDVTGLVFRGPKDRLLARQGWNEGPILAVSSRRELDFTQPIGIDEITKREQWAKKLRASRVDLLAQLQNPATRSTAEAHLHELGFDVIHDSERKIVRWSALDVVDFSQELGTLVMLAQMRARDCRSDAEVKPGKGRWWAENRRFGGHENEGEALGMPLFGDDMTRNEDEQGAGSGPDTSNADMASPPLAEKRGPIDPEAAMIAVSPSRIVSPSRSRRVLERATKESKEQAHMRARRHLSWKPPRPLYDPRTHYMPVGKGLEQEFDHVYLVSSLFHHVSILRLRVHPSMLAYISSQPDAPIARPPLEHYGLYTSRTRWFNLLDKGDRVEAMRGIWGVMAYLMRDTDIERPEDRAFARRLSNAGAFAEAAREA